METKIRYALRRIDGAYCNLHYEPVKDLTRAARWTDIDSFEQFIKGYYKPPDASIYYPQMIEITYRELENDEREEPLSENS